ncbi:MAG: hypothetical protein OXB98_06645 [Bryobacterales bacterium]|nr:hypothetical protein [Bryobacterales bacterium]
MAREEKSTITEDLLAYKAYMKRWPTETDKDYAEHVVEQPIGWVSNFSRYWAALAEGVISRSLHRVILLHNGYAKHRCEDRLVFYKTVFKDCLLLKRPKGLYCQVKYGPSEQDAALRVALGKPVDGATDEELLYIRYAHFVRALENPD